MSCTSFLPGTLQGKQRDLRGAVEAKGQADRADAAVDVKLEAIEVEEALDIFPAAFGQMHGAEKWNEDLPAVGVAGEHQVHQAAARVGEQRIGKVGAVTHQQNGAVRLLGDGAVEVGVQGDGVVDAAEPQAPAAPLDSDIFVDQQRYADGGKLGSDQGLAQEGIVVAHSSETLSAGDAAEDLGALHHGSLGELSPERAHADEVASEQDEVGCELVDAVDDPAQERGLGVLVEVEVADLGDAEVLERGGEIGDGEILDDDAELVAGELTGIERHASGCGKRGTHQELAARKPFALRCDWRFGDMTGHSP